MGVLVALTVAVAFMYFPGDEGDPYSSDPEERLAAIRYLAGNTDDESLKILRHLSDDSVDRVAFVAVKAVGKSADESEPNREVLSDILANSTSTVARSEAAAQLGKCPGADLKLLAETLKHDDPMIRLGAAKGLARVPERNRRRDTSKPRGRSKPGDAKALKARLRIILPPLIEALSDSDPRVRKWAITAIKRNTGQLFDYDPDDEPGKRMGKIRDIEATLGRQFSLK